MATHIVKQGEHLFRIAKSYGFRTFDPIWDDPNNADLKQKRSTPNVLLPGDQLFIPDRETRQEQRPTGQAHTFVVDKQPLLLRIVVKDPSDVPVANAACELELDDGTKYPLQTDGDGKIEQEIPPASESGVLRFADLDLEMPIQIGHLDPWDEDSGWTGRLANLGYIVHQAAPVDEDTLEVAIEEFQCDYGLTKTGEMDDATKAKLKELHGC